MPRHVPSACRLGHRELDLLARLDDERLPIAELHRRFASRIAAAGRPRPSYERTRTLVRALRVRPARTTALAVWFEWRLARRPIQVFAAHRMTVELPSWFPGDDVLRAGTGRAP